MRLRPYQDVLANHTTRALWQDGRRRVVWVIPTGGGKTACAEALIARVRAADWAPVYYFAHTSELVTQPGDRLRGRVEFSYLRAGHMGDPTCGVQVCSAQTAARRHLSPIPRADGTAYPRCVVFVDECHRVRSETYAGILAALAASYQHVYAVLMTATPYRRDGRGLAREADALVEAATPEDGIRDGWLADVDAGMWSAPPIDPSAPEAEQVAAQPKIVGDLVREWLRRAGGAPTVYRCVNRAHARDVAERFRAAGVRAAHIDGEMSVAARELLLARLAIGGCASAHPLAIDVLATGGTILEEGFDSAASYRHVLSRPEMWPTRPAGGRLPAPGAESASGLAAPSAGDAPPRYRPLACLGDAAPTTSRGAWIQRVGRVARTFGPADVAEWAARGIEADEKGQPVVLCHSGNLERHGFFRQHRGFTLGDDLPGAPRAGRAYSPPSVRQCPACFACAPPGAACPACGLEPDPSSSLPDEARPEAELVRRAWDPSAPPPDTEEQKSAFLERQWRAWLRARDERAARGLPPYSPWWPAARYRAKYGAHPDQSRYRAIAASVGVRF